MIVATVTSRTVLDEKAELSAFFDDVAGVSDTASRVLGANEDSIIRLGELSRPALRLLDTYSPEYPCLLEGIDPDLLEELRALGYVDEGAERGDGGGGGAR